MNTIRKKLTGLLIRPALLIALLLTAIIPAKADAGNGIDISRPVSLTLSEAYDGRALEGIFYRLYKVADFKSDGMIDVKSTFKNYPVSFNNWENNKDLASTLASYVARDGLKPEDSGTTDADGKLAFPSQGKSMLPGLYLLTADSTAYDKYIYDNAPVLLSLPLYNKIPYSYSYDVTVQSKTSRRDISVKNIERSVVKTWAGDNAQSRPKEITVQLRCNGAVYETVTLTADKGWSHTWKELPVYRKADGNTKVNEWSVTEKEVSGYTVSISATGNVFKITNTAKSGGSTMPTSTPTPTSSDTGANKLPQTGLLWWPLPPLIFAGLACMIPVGKIKKLRVLLSNGFFMLALALVVFNFAQDYRGYKASQNSVQQLKLAVEKNGDAEQSGEESADRAGDRIGNKAKTAERKKENLKELTVTQPDYILNPDMPMPETESEGNTYIGLLKIESLALELPVISQWSYDTLKVAPARYTGSAYLDNMVIAAHNFNSHFGRLKELKPGDTVSFTDIEGNQFDYEVSEMDILGSTEIEEMTSGNWDLTLFTCTVGGTSRVTVRCSKA